MLRGVRIDESGLGDPTDERRDEWRLAARELAEDHAFQVHAAFELEIAIADGDAVLLCAFDDGASIAMTLTNAAVSPAVSEYLAVCHTLARLSDDGAGSPRLEALDMAKKVAHDAGARVLMAHLAPLAPDHRTARRLFTLLVTLLFDTTKLATLRAHRVR